QVVHAQDPAAETHSHEQADLGLGDRDTDGTGSIRVTAHGENPVPHLGAQQDPGSDCNEDDPDEYRDLDLDAGDLDGGGEKGVGRFEAVDTGNRRGGYRST